MTNLPNTTPSEQPAKAGASPMTIQSLESEAIEILKTLCKQTTLADRAAELATTANGVKAASNRFQWAIGEATQALLKTVDRYVEEQLKQLKRHKVQTYSHMISFVDLKHHIKPDIEAVPIKHIDEQIATLRQQVKGGQE